MSVMENLNNINNGVNGAENTEGATSGRCPVCEQRGPGHHATAGTRWSKEMNVDIVECYFLTEPVDESGKPIRGYRRRMYNTWKERQGFNITEQRLCDQARMIRKNEWLTTLDFEDIKKRVIKVNFQEDECEEQNRDEATGEENNIENDDTGLVFENLQEMSNE